MGVEGYYREANFLSAVYNQTNYGIAIQARKQLWRTLSGRVEYRIEGIQIFDVDEDETGLEIQDAAGNYTKSAFTGALTWDTRDSLFLTRKGEVIEVTGFIAGGPLGGDVQDYGISVGRFQILLLPWDLILQIKGEARAWSIAGVTAMKCRFSIASIWVAPTTCAVLTSAKWARWIEFDNPIGGNSLGIHYRWR